MHNDMMISVFGSINQCFYASFFVWKGHDASSTSSANTFPSISYFKRVLLVLLFNYHHKLCKKEFKIPNPNSSNELSQW